MVIVSSISYSRTGTNYLTIYVRLDVLRHHWTSALLSTRAFPRSSFSSLLVFKVLILSQFTLVDRPVCNMTTISRATRGVLHVLFLLLTSRGAFAFVVRSSPLQPQVVGTSSRPHDGARFDPLVNKAVSCSRTSSSSALNMNLAAL